MASINVGSNVILTTSIGAFIGAISSLILLLMIGKLHKMKQIFLIHPLGYTIIAIASISLPIGFELSFQNISVSQTTAILQIYPILAALSLSWVFLRRRPQISSISIFFGVLAATFIIADIDGSSISHTPITGFGYGLILAFAAALTCGGGLISKHNSFSLSDVIIMVSAVCCIRFVVSIPPLLLPDEEIVISIDILKYAFFLGVFNHFASGTTAGLDVHYAKSENIFLLWVLQTPISMFILWLFTDENISLLIYLSVIAFAFGQVLDKSRSFIDE